MSKIKEEYKAMNGERKVSRAEGTYVGHAGIEKHEVIITRYIHMQTSDLLRRPGPIQVTYTIRGEGENYMAYAEAESIGGTDNIKFNGNSLWHMKSQPLKDMEDLVNSITGMDKLKEMFQ